MRINFNRRYNTIAIYCFLVVAASIIFYLLTTNFSIFSNYFSYLNGILAPFVYGFVFAFLLNPVLKFFENKVIKKRLWVKASLKQARVFGILITYAIAAVVVSVFLWIVVPEVGASVSEIVADLALYLTNIEEITNQILALIPTEQMSDELVQSITTSFTDSLNSLYLIISAAVPQVLSFAVGFSAGVLNIILGIIISVYFFLSKETFFAQTKKILYAFLKPEKVNALVEFTHESNQIFSGFIVGKLLDSLIIGILCFISLYMIGMPNYLLVSLIVGITNIIPYFGPFIGAIPCFFIIFIDDPTMALVFAVFILILQQFDGNILGPKILGDSIGLSAFWVVFSILVFSSFMGIAGLFIGVPTFAVIYSAIKKYVNYRLRKKALSTETEDYASPNHPIL